MARIIQTADLTPDSRLTPNESEWVYNGLDCCVTFEVLETLEAELDNTTRPTYEFSKALQAPILEMSTRGILVDQAKRYTVLGSLQNQIDILDLQLTEIVNEGIGVPFANTAKSKWWRSPAKLKNLLYDVMGLPVQRKRNVNGLMAPSTNRDSLEKLQFYFIAEPVVLHLLALQIGRAHV